MYQVRCYWYGDLLFPGQHVPCVEEFQRGGDCGVILLLWSCVESRVKVCEMLATFLASADVKASLVWGSFKRLDVTK